VARRTVDGPCAFCGKPAAITKLFSFRVRARTRKPVRVRICRHCESETNMGIEPNTDQLYTGAASKIVPPITGADCALFPTLDELVAFEQQAGRGATVRHGIAFAKRTPAEIAAACALHYPAPTSTTPTILQNGVGCKVHGTFFAVPGGTWRLGNAATWPACTILKVQPWSLWVPTQITCPAVTWDFAPATVWLYVTTSAGLTNQAGLMRSVIL
jgi:hypothetical protein